MSETKPPPPEGFATWLDHAVVGVHRWAEIELAALRQRAETADYWEAMATAGEWAGKKLEAERDDLRIKLGILQGIIDRATWRDARENK